MALFSKKPTELPTTIQHSFLPEEVAFRYPKENFITGSVLFVQPGQEAVMIKEGDQDGPYTNGRYTLNTNELPGIRRFFNKLYGDKGAFNCYVYFINKDKPVNVFWGTPQEIKVVDPRTGRYLRMHARGSMALTIKNSLQFIAKMNGQLHSFTTEDVGDFLFDKSIERIKSAITKSLQTIPFNEIQSYLGDIADKVKTQLITEKLFDAYGMFLAELSVVDIDINDEDFAAIQKEENELARKVRDLEELEKRKVDLEAYKIRSTGFAESDVMKEKGIYYDKERTYDVLQTAAANESGLGGGGSFVGAGIGLGVGMGAGAGIGQAFGQLAGNAFTPAQQPAPAQEPGVICPSCKAQNPPKAKFCQSCGGALPTSEIACPGCGAMNKAGAKFCGECGTSLIPAKKKCTQCGTENEAGSKFCGNCGNKMD
ncbi:MAG: SPFH domain-containing protein [Clostridia bacterium]|nr:SPFH domain-containing protein [Clostridia bacterium]